MALALNGLNEGEQLRAVNQLNGFAGGKSRASRVNFPDVTMMASSAIWSCRRPDISRITGAPTEKTFHCLH